MKSALSPRELAQAIGVSESSLKRWADEGIIRVSKTAGGHRRIPISEAIRLIRQTGLTVRDPRILGLDDLADAPDHSKHTDSETAQVLLDLLTGGREAETRGLLLSLYVSGMSLPDIFDGPVRKAMEEIGELWRNDSSGIFVEHRATDICIQAVTHLRVLLPPVENRSRIAIGGAPPGDPYVVPTLTAATVLASEGWREMNLGPETPLDLLGKAARNWRARLVWLSMSALDGEKQVIPSIRGLSQELQSEGIRLIIGGRTCPRQIIPPEPAITVGNSMAELAQFARNLSDQWNLEPPADLPPASPQNPPENY